MNKLENLRELRDKIEYLEDEAVFLKSELDRLGEKIQDMEMEEYDAQKLYRLAEKLYTAKITLSPALFERELKSFFMDSINKRL